MPMLWGGELVADAKLRELMSRLRRSADEVLEPQRSRILSRLPGTLFVSHTSLDDKFIRGIDDVFFKYHNPESILAICGERFHDPFYHNMKSGGAESYERIVGLSLLASARVLVIWSENASRSAYVRAEILIAAEEDKKIAAYLAPGAPAFPLRTASLIHGHRALRHFLETW